MTADDVVYTFNFINKNDKNRRHSKVSGWLDSIERTGKYSVRFNLKTPYANFLMVLSNKDKKKRDYGY